MDWEKRKKQVLERLQQEGARVDKGILVCLDAINSLPHYYTTSSCEGRVCILDMSAVGDKIGAVFRGKWHYLPEIGDAVSAIKECKSNGYLRMDPPIIHAVAVDTDSASRLIELGLSSGFKRSCIKSLTRTKITVELASTEVMEVPLTRDSSVLVSKEYLMHLLLDAGLRLSRGREKLKRLNAHLVEESLKY